MFTPFRLEEGLLDNPPFFKDEVRFNVFHRIVEDPAALTLKAMDGKALAVQNTGRPMWLWLDDSLDKATSLHLLYALAAELKDAKLPGIAARPEQATAFAEEYKALTGATYKKPMTIEAYECPVVHPPQGVAGKAIPAGTEHIDLIAEYAVGFVRDGYGTEVTKESQMAGAERLAKSGNTYLWEVNGEVVCMANVSHRSKRQARINFVYTPPCSRKKGYASALVAYLSQMILEEGLTPILFADVEYPASNKVYRTIGYLERGQITEYHFKYLD